MVSSTQQTFEITPDQQDIIDFHLNGGRNLLIDSVAGATKTTTIALTLQAMSPEDRSTVAATAFNTHITEWNKKRYPPDMEKRTKNLNQFGLLMCARAFNRKFGDNYVQTSKYHWILMDALKGKVPGDRERHVAANLLNSLLDMVRYSMTNVASSKKMEELIARHGIDLPFDLTSCQEIVTAALKTGLDQAHQRIDIIDQLWVPVVKKLPWKPYKRIICDEIQDVNPLGQKLLRVLGESITGCGDSFQAIFGFMGGGLDTFSRLEKQWENCNRKYLNICFRCPRTHALYAQEIVERLVPWEGAIEGEIDFNFPIRKLVSELEMLKLSDVAIVCRTNQPLIERHFAFTEAGIPSAVQGRGFDVAITDLVDQLTRRPLRWYDLGTAIRDYIQRKRAILEGVDDNDMQLSEVQDRTASLMAFYHAADDEGIHSWDGLKVFIAKSFVKSDNTPVDRVLLATGHGIKGKEFDYIFHISPHLVPHPKATQPWELQQEKNLDYILRTRSKKYLALVQDPSITLKGVL